jgi:two-component system, cell cycle sensor histidine kinase and response regulator CckA
MKPSHTKPRPNDQTAKEIKMFRFSPGIREKLIGIFILIKVIPLIILAWFAWNEMIHLAASLEKQVTKMVADSHDVVGQVGRLSSENSIRALDDKSREAIERLTTDTASALASFLYDRDRDIENAATLAPTEANYKRFLTARERPVITHAPWVLNADGTAWIPLNEQTADAPPVTADNEDNRKEFHYRPPEMGNKLENRPLFLEMTYVALDGQEKVKVTTSKRMPGDLRNISKRQATYCKAETYFEALKKLAPGEIYVSDVIGAYVKGYLIGPYTKQTAAKKGIPFSPETSGYAGKENPVGKRFEGLIRWATPVVTNGHITGYVTLALDHTHVMEFTDHILPTEERYSPISDASTGNYAFMWDYEGRCISHPRDYSIVGYDPETGEPAIPWLDTDLYDAWQKSGMKIGNFLATAPRFQEQRLQKKPAVPLIKEGLIGLDGRFLNFAPQCSGWHNLTQNGGSGSFVIFWSGLWKLSTAASIPYHTGQYGKHPRGFGYVTIGADVEEFHHAAIETAQNIHAINVQYVENLNAQSRQNQSMMNASLRKTARDLSLYTLVMIAIVILIAVWMAATLTGKITKITHGIERFQKGDLDYRLDKKSSDEMGRLARAFNDMADNIQVFIHDIKTAKETAENTNRLLKEEIGERQKAEKELALHRDNLEAIVTARTRELENEISERRKIETVLLASEHRLRKQNEGLLNLAGHKILYEGNLTAALRIIMEHATRTLEVERGSVWLLNENQSEIHLTERYELSQDRHSEGGKLNALDYPAFFKALEAGRTLPSFDAATDAVALEFSKPYLLAHGISSILSATILIRGQMRGLVCFEHVGNKRQWQIDEQNFSGSIADLVSLAISASERLQAEETQKQLEDKLYRAEKMEAIGTLAGGVAHDLNNILSGIVSYPELLLWQLPQGSELKGPIETIWESGKRAAAIVQDLLTLARRGVTVTTIVNLNTIVMEYLKSPEHQKLLSFHPNVAVGISLDPDLMNIAGSSIHLSTTLMNLISNAAEAMPAGGKISITTENRYIDRPINGYDDVKEGDYVVLSVSDTGTGISPKDMGRIFEPFYTKKKMGRSGTGLGMAVVWGTVKDHRGYIDFDSGEGKGSVFMLYFPVTRKEMEKGTEKLSINDYMGKGESILVVDDVKEQREIASSILTKLGYRVTTVSSGEKAVEYLKDHFVELLVMDMIMDPGMDGLDTYKTVLTLHPGQKAILASGYSETDRIREAQKLGAGEYLKKPYAIEKFGALVRKELDKPQHQPV